ncbi:MAG: MBL fold metallo-hydrolase [Phycisphaerales bacterium]|nr:MBL fold metallo-hydrolase [Phycisphaerales bacterium]
MASAGLLLAQPVDVLAEWMIVLVRWGAAMPGAGWYLHEPVSWWWALAMLGLMVSFFMGAWKRCPQWGLVLLLLLTARLMMEQYADDMKKALVQTAVPAEVRLHMLAVGEGSCLLLRIPDETQADGEHTLMFDCGSRSYLELGTGTVVPALRVMGYGEIDTLMISHVDLDHLSGTLDLAEQLPVRRLLVTPQFVREVETRPHSPAGYLLEEWQARNREHGVIEQGWKAKIGSAELELLWPLGERVLARSNDTSMVLSILVGDKRVLLTGDIADEAIEGLLASGLDLQADVMELPHHGSFTERSIDWLQAVQPELVLQSCGPGRIIDDPWKEVLTERSIHRLITRRDGMLSVVLQPDVKGEQSLRWETFRQE